MCKKVWLKKMQTSGHNQKKQTQKMSSLLKITSSIIDISKFSFKNFGSVIRKLQNNKFKGRNRDQTRRSHCISVVTQGMFAPCVLCAFPFSKKNIVEMEQVKTRDESVSQRYLLGSSSQMVCATL